MHPGNGYVCNKDDEDKVQETMHSTSISKRLRLVDIDPSPSSTVRKVTVTLEVSTASHTPDDGRSLSAVFFCTIDRSGFEWRRTSLHIAADVVEDGRTPFRDGG